MKKAQLNVRAVSQRTLGMIDKTGSINEGLA
jgi:hypothetical protein